MERIGWLRPVLGTSLLVLAAGGALALVLASLVIQPPYEAGADGTQQMLGWARAGLFTAGALAFTVGLAIALRGQRPSSVVELRRLPEPPRPLPAAFTLVALGQRSDDTRAIADAPTAGEAIRLLWEWAEAHPDEHVVIFNTDAEPVAFKRPVRAARLLRRGAA